MCVGVQLIRFYINSILFNFILYILIIDLLNMIKL